MLFLVTLAASNQPELERRRLRLGSVAGMTAPVLVSELSLGPRGWVQIVNFLLTGALLIVFGHTVTPYLRGGRAGAIGPILLQIIGLSLMASGPFVTDPSALFDQRTMHSLIHGIFGAVVFSLAPVTCFVF